MTDDSEFAAINARLNKQHRLLQKRIASLQAERADTGVANSAELDTALDELKVLEAKLLKSQELARKVYELRQEQTIEVRHAPYRTLGLALIIGSIAAGLALGAYALKTL